ncbi:hypothetical protein ALI144C_13865 [Actinosynnema sp. ALI-1.44]|uniref:hypothetical protein n=1 Tax=Actinosynnema sp. ALI-1.44 TaxID=1933779 RepID=UPI00097C14A5|nr:hypothetical protein [Actinosynnema sp. ALI-1.44]ONI85367.1 hypothetical protein ALI144C_13865 [Actinosynnema sp. ALI-1.44]
MSNDPFLPNILTAIGFVLSVILLPPGVIGLVRWNRRARDVRRHGWSRGQVEADGKRVHHIRFPTSPDHAMTVVTTRPVNHHISPEFRTGDVLVGGHGRRLVLVFTRGPVLAAARTVRGRRPDRR